MKDRSACIVDGHKCSSAEYEDDLMECSDFLDLVGLTKEMENGEVDIYIMAERIATLLGRTNTFEVSDEDLSCDDDDDDDDDDVDDDHHHHHDHDHDHNLARDNSRVEWTESDSNNTENHGHNLLLAGYTNCMDEAIRYLVEEEQYSSEHPVVQGLKQHLVSQQERVLVEAAARGNLTDADNRLAQRVDAFCTIRPPSI